MVIVGAVNWLIGLLGSLLLKTEQPSLASDIVFSGIPMLLGGWLSYTFKRRDNSYNFSWINTAGRGLFMFGFAFLFLAPDPMPSFTSPSHGVFRLLDKLGHFDQQAAIVGGINALCGFALSAIGYGVVFAHKKSTATARGVCKSVSTNK